MSASRIEGQAPWDAAFALFLERDLSQIRDAIGPLGPLAPAVAAQVMEEERDQLRRLCLRTLVLELNCARVLGQLPGDTPEARFDSFVARFAEPAGWSALFEEYPVLGAAVDATRAHFRAQATELFARLAADRALLSQIGVSPGATLAGASASLSDPHRGGRGVWQLAFDDGARAMYKPKPLAVDARFQWLLERCNAPGVPPLRPLKIVDRGAYGWVEFVAAGPCADDAAAARFYARQGALLALLHVLLGTDMHHENLIAHGEHPMLVDLETLFHPRIAVRAAAGTARGAAEFALECSALRVGLLPWRALRRDGKGGVNIGAVGDAAAQALPYTVPRWEGGGRDDQRLVEREIALPPGDNLPRIGGEIAAFQVHADAIAAGFSAMLRYIADERAAWVAPGGILDAFAADPIRYILRPTRTYAQVLQATAHPDYLRSPASADRVRALLDNVPDAVAGTVRVRDAENADLEVRDVPYFHGRPGSADLWDSRDVRIPDVFDEAPLETARALVAGLDAAEVERQCWLVRASLSAAAIGHVAPKLEWGGEARPTSRAIDLAAEIGERLAAQAIEADDGATWLGVVDCAADIFTVAPLRPDLYDGVAGVALFLAALGRATGEDRFLTLAHRAARTVRASLAEPAQSAGGFLGAPGRLYALAHVAKILDEDLAVPALDLTAGQVGDVDVIYGAAGSILALLAVGSDSLRPHLVTALETLERTAIRDGDTAAWACSSFPRPLLGFSHGTAGIAYALSRLAAAGIEPARCASLAGAALRYERARFDASRRNWPDFRAPDPAGRSLVAWCHGAPGIVLSRLSPSPDAASLAELETAVATTLSHDRRVAAHSLCHGDVGNLAIVSHAAHVTGRADWRAAVDARLPALLAALAPPDGPTLDAAFARAAPGLMTGIAGVGYGLLALADPTLPCVLALA